MQRHTKCFSRPQGKSSQDGKLVLSPLPTGSGCPEPRIQQGSEAECELKRRVSASNINVCHQQVRGARWLACQHPLAWCFNFLCASQAGAVSSPRESAWHMAGEALWRAAYKAIPSFTHLFYEGRKTQIPHLSASMAAGVVKRHDYS